MPFFIPDKFTINWNVMRHLLLGLMFIKSIISFGQTAEVKNYATLCKAWGFLKYYHPNLSTGKINWDSVLIQTIPNSGSINTQDKIDKSLRSLLDIAGEYSKKNEKHRQKDSLITFVNWKWIDQELKDPKIKQTFRDLTTIAVDSNKYVTDKTRSGIKIGYPRFINNVYYSW